MVRKFNKGDRVMAQWPGNELYFNGTVVDFNDIEYLVQFDDSDASEFPIKYGKVRVPFTRSSKSRSQSRGRTPTRKPKSPSRKSSTKKASSKSPSRTPSKPRTTALRSRRITRRSEGEEVTKTIEITKKKTSAVRQSSRISSLIEKTSTTVIDGKTNSIKVDRELVEMKIQESKTWKGVAKRIFTGMWMNMSPLTTCLWFLAFPIVLTQLCTKNHCTLRIPDFPKKWKYYYDIQAMYMVAGVFLISFMLACLPIGKTFKLKNGSTHRCNGFLGLLVALSVVPASMYLEVNILGLYTLFRPLLTASLCFAGFLSIFLFIKSFYVSKCDLNPEGTTGYYLADFLYGREAMPSLFGVGLKPLFFRTSIYITIIAQTIIFMKNYQSNENNVLITLLISCLLQMFLCVDMVIFEETMLTSYEHTRNGFGLITLIDYASIPYVLTFFSRFIANRNIELAWYYIVPIIAIHFLGYIISRGANCQKHSFKSNPSSPAVANLESIAAGGSSRLLVSGWWGLVRHPNYLGDILVYLSWTLLCGFDFALPWIIWGASAIFLTIRTITVEADCKKKYGLAWSTYTNRVPYRLIPRIF